MDRQELLKTLVRLLEEETGDQFENVRENDDLREQLGVDSVDLINLVANMENLLRIRIATEELQNLRTVGHVIDLLKSKVNSQPQPRAA